MKKWLILMATGMAMMVVGIDFTVVNTILINIKRDLHFTINSLQWVMLGFGVLFSTLLVTMGRIGDIKGRCKVFYMGVVGFAVASLGAGFANEPSMLISMRILQGFFAASIYPTGMAITSNAFPPEQRGRALGIYGSIVGVGMASGPVFGSLMITLLNWRWVFFINFPIILISLLICLPLVSESKHPEKLSVDWLGAISLIIFLATLTIAVSESSYYGWLSGFTIGLLVIAMIALLSFIFIEKKVKQPLLPLRLFFNRGFLIGLIVSLVSISLAWPILFIMPIYLHQQFNFTTGIVGLMLLPMTVMTIIFPTIAGYLMEKTNYSLKMANWPVLFILAGIFLLIYLPSHGHLWFVIPVFIIFGIGWGLGIGMAIPLSLSYLEKSHDHGVVSGGCVTLFNLFAVLALTFYTMIFHHGEKISFMYGMKLSNCYLLVVTVCLWLIMLVAICYINKRS